MIRKRICDETSKLVWSQKLFMPFDRKCRRLLQWFSFFEAKQQNYISMNSIIDQKIASIYFSRSCLKYCFPIDQENGEKCVRAKLKRDQNKLVWNRFFKAVKVSIVNSFVSGNEAHLMLKSLMQLAKLSTSSLKQLLNVIHGGAKLYTLVQSYLSDSMGERKRPAISVPLLLTCLWK